MLRLPPVRCPHPQRCPQQRRFNIMHRQRVARQHCINPAMPNQTRQWFRTAGMHHHRPCHRDDLLPIATHLLHDAGGLPHSRFYLPLRRNLVAHEREPQTVALLSFGNHPNALHAHHNLVARFHIAQAPAHRCPFAHHNHRVHALIGRFNPLPPHAHLRPLVRRRIEILRRAAVFLRHA